MGEGLENFTKENNREEGEVMDTPERSKNCQIATPIAKFEDSPVFNFLNSLSPIKPVKSTHISQTINPLSFASPPSVFTSPHVSSGKESRFLPRHQLSDPSKPEFSFDEGNTVDKNKVNADAIMQLVEHQQNVNPKALDSEVNIERVNQVDQNKEATSCEWKNMISDTSNLLVFESPNDTDSYKKSIDPGTSFCISIKNDMLNMQSLCALCSDEHDGEGSEAEHLSTQPGEGNEMAENAETCDATAGPSLTNHGEEMDYEHLPGFYRGMRRRCLVFEMAGARRKHLDENLGSDSSILLQSDGNTSSNDPKLVSMKAGNDSSCCVLPGIGLHLNALATASKDYRIVNNDSSASRRLLIGPSSLVNFHPSTTGQELLNNVLPVALSDRGIDRAENVVVPIDDGCQASGYVANEDTNQCSPKKRRRRAEHTVEGEACKRCNCKKSKCLKLYCECFAAGVYCVEPCACIDCFNKPIHEDTVLATRKQIESRNPLAFAPKVIRGTDSVAETADDSSKTPASARHKRGCNCKKSGCLKKYCECYQGGVGCSFNCRCEGCKNAFGRKDGMEAEAEEHATDMKDKSVVDRSFEKTTIENNLEQNTDSVPLGTPLHRGRKSVHLPFSWNKKPPRSSFPSVSSSGQGLGNSSFLPPPPGLEKHFETVREDEMPDFLQGGSPNSGIKMSSPTQKRVSPPHSAGTSPGLRSSRKLILKSIPSFPSLTQ